LIGNISCSMQDTILTNKYFNHLLHILVLNKQIEPKRHDMHYYSVHMSYITMYRRHFWNILIVKTKEICQFIHNIIKYTITLILVNYANIICFKLCAWNINIIHTIFPNREDIYGNRNENGLIWLKNIIVPMKRSFRTNYKHTKR